MSEDIVSRQRRGPGHEMCTGDGVTTELAIFDWARGALRKDGNETLWARIAQHPHKSDKVTQARFLVELLHGLEVEPSGRVEMAVRANLRPTGLRRLFTWLRKLRRGPSMILSVAPRNPK